MKTKFIIIVTVLSLSFASCKNEEKVKSEKEVVEDIAKNFSLEMDIISPNKDDFSLFYTEDGTINFSGDKAVWHGVKAQAESQKIVFNLKEEIIPTNIRVDFGLIQDKGDVTVEKFKLNYYGKTFEAKGSEFLKYFIPNEALKSDIDEAKGTIRFQKLPNKPFTPFFYPQQAILDEIKKITV